MAQIATEQKAEGGPNRPAANPQVRLPVSPQQEAAELIDALTTHLLSVHGTKKVETASGSKVETWTVKSDGVMILFRKHGDDIFAALPPAAGAEPSWQSLTGKRGTAFSPEHYRKSKLITDLVSSLNGFLMKGERDLKELRLEKDAAARAFFGSIRQRFTDPGVGVLTALLDAKPSEDPYKELYTVTRGTLILEFKRENGKWGWRDPSKPEEKNHVDRVYYTKAPESKHEREKYLSSEQAKEDFFKFELSRQLALMNTGRDQATVVRLAKTPADKVEKSRYAGECILRDLLGAEVTDGKQPEFVLTFGETKEERRTARFRTDERGLWQWSANGADWKSIRYLAAVPEKGDPNLEKLNAVAYYLLPINAAAGEK